MPIRGIKGYWKTKEGTEFFLCILMLLLALCSNGPHWQLSRWCRAQPFSRFPQNDTSTVSLITLRLPTEAGQWPLEWLKSPLIRPLLQTSAFSDNLRITLFVSPTLEMTAVSCNNYHQYSFLDFSVLQHLFNHFPTLKSLGWNTQYTFDSLIYLQYTQIFKPPNKWV